MKKILLYVLIAVLLISFSVCSADFSGKGRPEHFLRFQLEGSSGSAGDETVYNRALKLYESQKFYDAWKLFTESQYGDWERMANKCTLRWPRDGEVYHDSTQWLMDTQLTFRVDQPEDTAIFIKVYKDDVPASMVFIGGPGEVMIKLPGNQSYTIKDGVGSTWFGEEDAFGPNGAYETMTFGQRGETQIYLERKMDYTITINVDNVIGEDIGSIGNEWENFR